MSRTLATFIGGPMDLTRMKLAVASHTIDFPVFTAQTSIFPRDGGHPTFDRVTYRAAGRLYGPDGTPHYIYQYVE